jgi:hypothetical protein
VAGLQVKQKQIDELDTSPFWAIFPHARNELCLAEVAFEVDTGSE